MAPKKRNDSLMELGDWQTAMRERYIRNPDVASRHDTPTDLIHKDLQERIHRHVFSCVFFFRGGFVPPVLPSDIVTSRNKGALPPWFFLPGFYVLLISCYMFISISMAFAY